MIRINFILVIALIALFISGCATVAKGPSYSEVGEMQAKEGFATLFVFREYAEPTAWGAKIHIDSKKVATLNQGGFTRVYVKPGNREIVGKWGATTGQRESKISLNIEANKAYFVELTGLSKLTGTSATATGVTMHIITGSGLNQVNQQDAEKRLVACCVLQKAEKYSY